MNSYQLSVVIPCLNEEETIRICIEKCFNSFEKLGIKGEVIISDNGSTDKSVEIAEKLGAKVYAILNKGYGIALKNGFSKAEGAYILMGDGDNSYDFNQIDIFYNKIQEGYDMVTGSRFKGKIHRNAMPFLHRYLGTPVLTILVDFFWGLKISDCQCGMKIFKKDSLQQINLESNGMEFVTELSIKAAIANWKITEVPIEFFKDGRSRKPHLRTWPDGLRNLKLILKTKIKDCFK